MRIYVAQLIVTVLSTLLAASGLVVQPEPGSNRQTPSLLISLSPQNIRGITSSSSLSSIVDEEEEPPRREAYFNGNAKLQLLSSFVSVHRHSGLNFRTCEPGRLFDQRFEGGGSISLSVDHEGLLFVARIQQKRYEARLNAKLLDNKWHNVNLVFRLGNFTLSAAGHSQVVANATFNSEILTLPDHNINGTLTVGEDFRGCILQGPGILFNDTVTTNAVFGSCPLAAQKGCGQTNVAPSTTQAPTSGSTDFCKNMPCSNRGKCISKKDHYECQCYARYSGSNCQNDHGSACKSNSCRNGATCVEDGRGDYSCICPPGFGGPRCETLAGSRACDANPCRHDGTCMELNETYYHCECKPGWTGQNCEIDIDECVSQPCKNGGNCTDLVNGYSCKCDHTGYKGAQCEVDIDECLEHPCLNQGTCYNIYGSYVCACPRGFEGQNCENYLKECLSGPCRNGGQCIDEVGSYRCNCTGTNYAGEHCEFLPRSSNLVEINTATIKPPALPTCENFYCPNLSKCVRDPQLGAKCVCIRGYVGESPDCVYNHCAHDPCLNGGTCATSKDGYECTCPPEWRGKNCQLNVNECDSHPCQNGGVCIDRANGYSCNCTADYMGEHCEKPYEACVTNPCENNGTCILSVKSKREFVCKCAPGWEGKTCSVDVDDCLNVKCPFGKTCIDGINGYECRCPEGTLEPNCTRVVENNCFENACNNGTCIDLEERGYLCNCNEGYTGEYCEDDVDECLAFGNTLCVNGICVNKKGGYNCFCTPGFSGDHCDVDIDECLPQPCKNNGTCIDRINTFECQCPKGYTGKTCEQEVNECESSPCQNGATCQDEIGRYVCLCAPGFEGQNCESDIDECANQPCLNEGQCIDQVNGYICNCTDTGFKGDLCEVNINDCLPDPCEHGAQCIDLVKGFKCKCWEGYNGERCENDINECESSPCQHNGTCLERSIVDMYRQDVIDKPEFFNREFSYANASGYECKCVLGTTGKNCETDIDECASNPCRDGQCIDGIGSYTCVCNEGFEGKHCEIDIDECEKYKPCQHGFCIDRRANYHCSCDNMWGGKNCSVELTGCQGNVCMNNGSCTPYLADETEHKFNCSCPNGFYGDICDRVTTMSLSGKSFVMVNSSRDEGYDIQFRFRTTLPNGLLAMGKGLTFYMLRLFNGKLNLQTSLVNEWEGVYIGSGLNDSNWQKVFVAINATHLLLSANDKQTIYPINSNEATNSSFTSFSTTYVGNTISYLRNLAQGPPFFIGCIEDVVINGEWIYAGIESNNVLMDNVEPGCPREEQCSPNPCQNNGQCTDRWRDFSCKCERPYLGHTCQHNMTAATFGYENISDSYVTVRVSEAARKSVRSIVDISMFIRTRVDRGDIFYLGSEPSLEGSPQTFIASHLDGGELILKLQFNGTEDYRVTGVKLNDGNDHLIQVVRNSTFVQIKINGSEYFRKTISSSAQLNVTVLYLGGTPRPRTTRQADIRAADAVPLVNFKGIIQDVQISNGSGIMVVEFYPLNATDIPTLLQFGNVTFDKDKVLEGVVSDNVCASNPCDHNGTCHVTWNDFWCACPRGYTGKTCQEMEFCQLQDCPQGSTCQNLDDGYECVANATFDGVRTAFSYVYYHSKLKNASTASKIETISITYRSKTGGTLMHIAPKASAKNQHFTVSVRQDKVMVAWKLDPINAGMLAFGKPNPDGNWTTILLKLGNDSVEGTYEGAGEDVAPQVSSSFNFATWYEMLLSGTVTLGGMSSMLTDKHSYVTYVGSERRFDVPDGILGNSVEFSDRKLTTILPPHTMMSGEAFKGCLGEVRIGSMLLHYFTYEEVYQNANFTPLEFLFLQRDNATNTHENLGCRLCFENNCKNNGRCHDQLHSYVCDCPAGYAEDDCSMDIDECVDNKCQNESVCKDGVANYTCICNKGWTGWLCDHFNECELRPCHNGGRCVNSPGSYHCECLEQFAGEHCEIPKIITCENTPCHNGATCLDIKNSHTDNNFTCSCTRGYVEPLCDTPYCVIKPCENGGTCLYGEHHLEPKCACIEGFIGDSCQTNVDDCVLDEQGNPPCKNEGRCIDLVNDHYCNCTNTGYTGSTCEDDINECESEVIRVDCGHGHCENLIGSYHCVCDDYYCGVHCNMVDPCVQNYCQNGGTCSCMPGADGHGSYMCDCTEDYSGQNCTESNHPFLGSRAFDIAVIVGPILAIVLMLVTGGLVVLFVTARKKRATRGTYSPSQQEYTNPRVEMDHVLKPPPEERLI